MNSNSLVSIIIIFLNGKQFIQEAIESIFAQTYENWELLLVDDGSADGSTLIAHEYGKKYPEKIRYLEHEGHQNCGKSTSRNLGIYNARGKYVAFLDADDVWLPKKLEKQVAILESNPQAGMVYGNTLYWYSWTGKAEDKQRDYIPILGLQPNTLMQPPSLLQLLLGSGGAVPCICSFLVKREILEDIGGFEESIQHLYEDQVLLAKIFLKTPVFVEDGCWEKYRQRNDSSWHISMHTGEDYHASLIFLNWLKNYLAKQDVQDVEIEQALEKKMCSYRNPIRYKMPIHIRHFLGRIKEVFKSILKLTFSTSG
ncbi:family 2 glycosyl transferase [Cylindrospermum sp. NIES-4074]|nr:family 2 glycosyl transferase [Cylindrospermum sp. NIES-4074]